MPVALGGHYSESDRHVIRRLESFSDIIIGFSLAQAAYNLVIPPHPLVIFTQPVGLVAFVFTFAVVASIWWSHSLLFQHFFVPVRPTYALCFIALALTVLVVFTLQVWLHFVGSPDSLDAARVYFGTIALTYCVMGALFIIGIVRYRAILAPDVLLRGSVRCFGLMAAFLGTTVGLASSLWYPLGKSYFEIGGQRGRFPFECMLGLVAAAVATRIYKTIGKRRLRKAASNA